MIVLNLRITKTEVVRLANSLHIDLRASDYESIGDHALKYLRIFIEKRYSRYIPGSLTGSRKTVEEVHDIIDDNLGVRLDDDSILVGLDVLNPMMKEKIVNTVRLSEYGSPPYDPAPMLTYAINMSGNIKSTIITEYLASKEVNHND